MLSLAVSLVVCAVRTGCASCGRVVDKGCALFACAMCVVGVLVGKACALGASAGSAVTFRCPALAYPLGRHSRACSSIRASSS